MTDNFADTVINLRYEPRRNMIEPGNCPRAIRTYRESPETIIVQIRRQRDVTSASLRFDEARVLAAAILNAIPSEDKP